MAALRALRGEGAVGRTARPLALGLRGRGGVAGGLLHGFPSVPVAAALGIAGGRAGLLCPAGLLRSGLGVHPGGPGSQQPRRGVHNYVGVQRIGLDEVGAGHRGTLGADGGGVPLALAPLFTSPRRGGRLGRDRRRSVAALFYKGGPGGQAGGLVTAGRIVPPCGGGG